MKEREPSRMGKVLVASSKFEAAGAGVALLAGEASLVAPILLLALASYGIGKNMTTKKA